MSKKRRRIVLFIIFVVTIVAIDQVLKGFIECNLVVSETVPIIKNVLHVTYVRNTGALWGLFKGYNFFLIFFSISAIAAIVFYMFIILRKHKTDSSLHEFLCLTLIISGAIGNLIDRFSRGYIVDFIDLRIWPVFNLADTMITFGIIFLIINLIKSY